MQLVVLPGYKIPCLVALRRNRIPIIILLLYPACPLPSLYHLSDNRLFFLSASKTLTSSHEQEKAKSPPFCNGHRKPAKAKKEEKRLSTVKIGISSVHHITSFTTRTATLILQMGGKTWSRDEEVFFWRVIVPRSPKAVIQTPDVLDWAKCAQLMQKHFGNEARREYTKLMLCASCGMASSLVLSPHC